MVAFLGIVMLTFSAVYSSKIMDYCASILLAPAILMIFIINIYTWKKGQPEPLTFNKMVKNDLDQFFKKKRLVQNGNITMNETVDPQIILWENIGINFW